MGFKNLVLMFGGSLCASMCGCGEEDDVIPAPYEPVDRVTVLVVDDATNKFEGGEYYFYNQLYPSFNLKTENVPANDVGYITVLFEEGNQMIYYATQFSNRDGEIIVPKPFKDPSYFDVLEDEDFLTFPNDAIRLTGDSTEEVKEKWNAIQNLRLVRMAADIKDNKVFYFKQDLNTSNAKKSKWVFIMKY